MSSATRFPKKIVVLVLCVVALGIIAWALAGFLGDSNTQATNDAYVMDEKGALLDIREVRERLINGKTLIVNPDANWNHKTSVIKEEYLYNYMAKNLYRLECTVASEYDTEARTQGKTITYVELLPLDAYNQLPQKTEYTIKKTGTTFINYKTNNPDTFWAVPE